MLILSVQFRPSASRKARQTLPFERANPRIRRSSSPIRLPGDAPFMDQRTTLRPMAAQNTPDDLRNHTFVRIGVGTSPSEASALIDRLGNPERPSIRVENTASAQMMIEQGAGIGSLFCARADTIPNMEQVFRDPFDQVDCWVIYHASARGSQRVRLVLDALVSFLNDNRARLTGLA